MTKRSVQRRVALKLEQASFDVAPLAGGLDRWLALDLPVEARPLEALPELTGDPHPS